MPCLQTCIKISACYMEWIPTWWDACVPACLACPLHSQADPCFSLSHSSFKGRLNTYSGSQAHRLGVNYIQIPVNCPFAGKVRNYQRDGPQCVTDNQSKNIYVLFCNPFASLGPPVLIFRHTSSPSWHQLPTDSRQLPIRSQGAQLPAWWTSMCHW